MTTALFTLLSTLFTVYPIAAAAVVCAIVAVVLAVVIVAVAASTEKRRRDARRTLDKIDRLLATVLNRR